MKLRIKVSTCTDAMTERKRLIYSSRDVCCAARANYQSILILLFALYSSSLISSFTLQSCLRGQQDG